MNRREEYERFLNELEQPAPEVEGTLERAMKKRRFRRTIVRPLVSAAAVFVMFVLIVNFSGAAAYACSQIPVLKELAAAVTFSRSLTDAVENEYLQPLYLTQTDGDVTVTIDSLIVDQKQVNVFFRLYSDVYTKMNAEPTVLAADGLYPASCSYGVNDWDVPNGELQTLSIDFVNEDVPDSLLLKMKIRDFSAPEEDMEPSEANAEDDFFNPQKPADEDYAAEVEFLLKFDPQFTAAGKHLAVNETVTLGEQQIMITDVEIYPSHLRIDLADVPENTAWLRDLYFYIKTDDGRIFDPVSEGITATGTEDTPMMTSFRADSTWFYEAEKLDIVITGAKWLRKDMERTYINLETGETGELPEGVGLVKAEEKASGWQLAFRAKEEKLYTHYQVIGHKFYDAEGKEYEIRSWSTSSEFSGEHREKGTFIVEIPLAGYHEKEVWIEPSFSHKWETENPVTITVETER